MHQGHHGANHPVMDHTTDKVEITSMNHGFAVDRASLPADVEETHVSLFDGSNCGLRVKGKPVFSVQYHPEASPWPRGQPLPLPPFREFDAEAEGHAGVAGARGVKGPSPIGQGPIPIGHRRGDRRSPLFGVPDDARGATAGRPYKGAMFASLFLSATLLLASTLFPAIAAADWRETPWRSFESELWATHHLSGLIWGVGGAARDEAGGARRRARQKRFVLLGEFHDNPDHHRLQAWLVAQLKPSAVVLEMVETDQAAALASFQAITDWSPANLGKALDWEARGWPPWSSYQPIAEAAQETGASFSPAMRRRDKARAVAKQGLAALDKTEAARLGLDKPLPFEFDETLQGEIAASHCGMLPETVLPAMAMAQRLRDATMAEALLTAAGRGGRAVLITGNGHARRERARAVCARGPGRRAGRDRQPRLHGGRPRGRRRPRPRADGWRRLAGRRLHLDHAGHLAARPVRGDGEADEGRGVDSYFPHPFTAAACFTQRAIWASSIVSPSWMSIQRASFEVPPGGTGFSDVPLKKVTFR